MLICPKCQKIYEDGAQRFCINDGVRLNPQTVKQNTAQTTGVFSGVLNKKGLFEDKTEIKNLSPKLFKEPFETKTEIKKQEPEKTETETPKTFTKLIKPDEVLNNQTPLGDRSVKPFGRVALTTVLLSLPRKFPNWSSTRSTGCCGNATPAVAVVEG